MLVPVEGESNLFRDINSNNIVNKNISEYEAYVSQRNEKQEDKKKISNIENQLSSLRNDLDEIKKLLLNLNK